MNRTYDQFYGLKWGIVVLVALPMLLLVDLGLRVMRYRDVCRWLIRFSPSPQPNYQNRLRARATGRVVNQISNPLHFTCLRRSLTLWWLLRWLRIPTELRFGVNQDEIHVWVEHYGEVINDRYNIASYYAITYIEPLAPDKISHLEAL